MVGLLWILESVFFYLTYFWEVKLFLVSLYKAFYSESKLN